MDEWFRGRFRETYDMYSRDFLAWASKAERGNPTLTMGAHHAVFSEAAQLGDPKFTECEEAAVGLFQFVQSYTYPTSILTRAVDPEFKNMPVASCRAVLLGDDQRPVFRVIRQAYGLTTPLAVCALSVRLHLEWIKVGRPENLEERAGDGVDQGV
jgi:hypothetical protein